MTTATKSKTQKSAPYTHWAPVDPNQRYAASLRLDIETLLKVHPRKNDLAKTLLRRRGHVNLDPKGTIVAFHYQRGGFTVCMITWREGIAMGAAKQNLQMDTYDQHFGELRAFRRALRNMAS